ncbi:MAG: hypothetical protein EOP11_05105 [Proteobacteria bacterium]|nr:MAG: hypothetical protein EOP11_05105 [Pseudomonadota bacterium]
MIWLPWRALSVMFSHPKVLALAFFPGALTFAASVGAVYAVWQYWLSTASLLIAIPTMMLTFLLSWLFVGNLSLIPVEDLLIDECQRRVWGTVRLPARPFNAARFLRELVYSGLVTAAAVVFFVISFIPFFAPANLLIAGWLTSYGFLAPLYERKQAGRTEGRIALFFEHAPGNLILGMSLNVLLFVPVVNVFLLGYAQILATLVFLRREHELSANPEIVRT